MEPALKGFRYEVGCSKCRTRNSWTADAWDSAKEVRCQFCDEYLDTSEATLVQGESILYTPWFLWNRRSRSGSGEQVGSSSSPIRLWDLVVIDLVDSNLSERGQVKRVVGLPGQSVSIRQGRIWIDGSPVLPTPEELMQQAVLMDSWNARKSSQSLSDFVSVLDFPIDNELPINAQDSHQRLAVQDVGIAFRFSKSEGNWNLKIRLRHGQGDLPIELSCYENTAQFSVGQPDGSVQMKWIHAWKPAWINLLVIGNRLILLDEKQQKVALDLPPLEEGLGWSDLSLVEPLDLVDRCLVYRGLHFRGARDADVQEFQPADGWIVLGDNVSISQDSRYWEHERVEKDRIRGLVNKRPALLEGLIKQLP